MLSQRVLKEWSLCVIRMIANSFFSLWRRLKTNFSDFLSIAEVASSKINNCGLKYNARIIEIICFWPPDKLMPSSPIIVL
jgi:hypothetical protein